MIMEQFKKAIPQQVATSMNEQTPPTALKAAELSDDFVLTHKVSIMEARSGGTWKDADRRKFNLDSGENLESLVLFLSLCCQDKMRTPGGIISHGEGH